MSAETLMHIFIKDNPYHNGLGLVDSQLKNLVLAFIEAPTLYTLTPRSVRPRTDRRSPLPTEFYMR